jgi:uncharacterized protein (TIGR00725 family)
MANSPVFHHDGKTLYDSRGIPFDCGSLGFSGQPAAIDPKWEKFTAREAVRRLQSETRCFRPPVAVVGPREAAPEQRETAHAMGRDLAECGLTVICGGRQGVMEAVCRGAAEQGGLSIGLLPDDDWRAANPYVGVPIATGIGIARNALISRSCHVMAAVGAGLGTLSELALALQFGKRVFAVHDRDLIEGVRVFPSWEELKPYFYAAILGAP